MADQELASAAQSVRHRLTKLGLDFSSPDTITPEEVARFDDFYAGFKGERLEGHDFLLEFRPDVLKRYWLFASEVFSNEALATQPLGMIRLYAVTGWLEGLRQQAHNCRQRGVQKAEVLDALAVASLTAGPRGMQSVARSLTPVLREWVDAPPRSERFPDHWTFDAAAFDCGLDYDRRDLDRSEEASLRNWHSTNIGRVPEYVAELLRDRPSLLKAHWHRYEKAFRALPKQMMPFLQIQSFVYSGNDASLVDAIALGRSFGMTEVELRDAIVGCIFYAGPEGVQRALTLVVTR